jgi:hypothetical protein
LTAAAEAVTATVEVTVAVAANSLGRRKHNVAEEAAAAEGVAAAATEAEAMAGPAMVAAAGVALTVEAAAAAAEDVAATCAGLPLMAVLPIATSDGSSSLVAR